MKEEEETRTKRRRQDGGEGEKPWQVMLRFCSVYLQVVINVPKGWTVPGFVCLSVQLYLTNWVKKTKTKKTKTNLFFSLSSYCSDPAFPLEHNYNHSLKMSLLKHSTLTEINIQDRH